jgi:hypothetical protein
MIPGAVRRRFNQPTAPLGKELFCGTINRWPSGEAGAAGPLRPNPAQAALP